jgi:hypothetical protein
VRRLNGSICLQQARWKRLLLILALLPLPLALNSCGGGSSTPAAPTPTITASCAASSVAVNGTVQCTANILNLNSTLADWQAGGVAGGNSTFGTIDVNGLYTAPKAVPANNIVTITAIAHAQTTLTATASVTILQPTKISSVVCLDPATKASTLTVASSKSVACTALTSENVQVPVFWQVNGNTIPIPQTLGIGTMTAQGNYRAPLIPPAGGTITITAVSQVDSTQTMSVTVTDTFGNAVLQGSYAFSSSGRQTATNGFFSRAGSFVADGNGGLTGGLEDVNPRPSGITQEPITFSGSYSIGPDGRGTMQFCEPSNSNSCISPTTQFRVVVISPQQAQIIDFQGGSTANGEIVLQPDISVFNTGSVIGTYTFSFSGFSSATSEESAVGEFAADGLPDKVTGLAKITSGELDINSGGVTTSQVAITSGTYSVSSNGRGTATLVTSGLTLNLAFYMVSASRAKFLETDSSPILAGDSFKQKSLVPWGASALSGSVVLGTAGTGPSSGIADLASFTASATSGANGSVTAASIDENSGGTVSSSASLVGTYAFDSSGNGRGTLGIPGHSYVFYMIAPAPAAVAVVQEITAGIVAHGSMLQQQPPTGSSFTAASFIGSYAFDLSGLVGIGEEDTVGQLTADGDPTNISPGKITSGTLDINNFGTLQAGQANTGTYDASIATSGRTTMSLTSTGGTPHGFVLYFVSPTAILGLGTDSTGPTTVGITKQF